MSITQVSQTTWENKQEATQATQVNQLYKSNSSICLSCFLHNLLNNLQLYKRINPHQINYLIAYEDFYTKLSCYITLLHIFLYIMYISILKLYLKKLSSCICTFDDNYELKKCLSHLKLWSKIDAARKKKFLRPLHWVHSSPNLQMY